MIKEDDNLLNDFEDNYLKKKRKCRCCLIISLIIILILIIITIIFLFYFHKKDKTEEIDDIHKDNPYTLDTIPDEELNKARNSFHHYFYNDGENPNLILPYNLFIPENYTKTLKYPLILFIGDETTYGKEITLPINKTIGGPIWATETFQKEHNCFVLIPQFNENILDNKEENIKNEYLNMLIRLIYKIQNDFKIDSNRIYGTGQSIGADTIIDLLKNNSNVFSSIIITNGININKEIISKFNKSFIYFASEENLNCFNIQIDIKNYLNIKNIKFGSIINVNPLEKVQILNQIFKEMFIKNYTFNFVTFSKRKDFHYKDKNNDIEIYKYSYRTEVVRDWLFSQNMIKCDDNYYYSEEFGKCFSINKKKVYLIKYNKETDMLYNLLKNASFISKIKIGSPDIIPLMTTDFLKEYDCIIYDFYDTSYLINTDKKDEIKSYLKSGGSFLVTHDKWDSDKGPLELIGLKYNHNDTEIEISSSKRAKVSRYGHSLFDCYHDLTDWRIIDIRKTHKSHHIIKNDIKNTARVIMEFEKDIETGIKYDYLTVNEIGKGRIAYWAAGHHDDITEDEQKLFINIVSWLTRNKQ